MDSEGNDRHRTYLQKQLDNYSKIDTEAERVPEEVHFIRLTSKDIVDDFAQKIETLELLPIEYQLLTDATLSQEFTYESFVTAYQADPTILFEKLKGLVIAEAASKKQVAEMLQLLQKQADIAY
jgi:hypothetical protein